ncbi:hypothetical protein FHS64_002190 [Brevundimonas terrae]|nr:hypothetical protein [Brevundimonas terrae]
MAMLVLRNQVQAGEVRDRACEALPKGVTHIREYVGSMSSELAQMARGQGDERLACLLELAAEMAKH